MKKPAAGIIILLSLALIGCPPIELKDIIAQIVASARPESPPPESPPPGPVIRDDIVFAFGSWYSGSNFDVCLKKFDKSGTEDAANWNKVISDGDAAYADNRVMAMDSKGNIYVTYAFGNPGSGYDWRIKKFNSSGAEVTSGWNKIVVGTMGTGHDWPTELVVDHDDNVYVVGYFRDSVDQLQMDWVIKKYTSDGTEITAGWNKQISGSGSPSSPDMPYAAAVDSGNNLYVTGIIYSAPGATRNVVIKKYSSTGVEDTTNWNKNLGSSGSLVCMTVDSSDNVYVGGQSLANDAWVRKYSSAGVQAWDKTIDIVTWERVNDMALDSSGNLYLAGSFSTTDMSWFIKKLNSAGTEITTGWNKQIDSGQEDVLASVAVGGQDDVYVFGTYRNGGTNYDWVIKKYDKNGTEDVVNWNKIFDSNNGSGDGLTILVDYYY